MLYTYFCINGNSLCACLTCANIYVKLHADEGSLTPSEALQLQEMPDMLLSEILTVVRLEFCTFACNKFTLLSF